MAKVSQNSAVSSIKITFINFSANKKKYDEFKYGNYRNYYLKRRLGNELTDIRLQLMEQHPEYFKDKKVLDIGCNSGYISLNIAKKLNTKLVMGIDIDPELINIARRYVEKQKTDPNLTEEERTTINSVIFRTVRFKF